MTFIVLKDEVRTARNFYPCDASRWWFACGCVRDDELTPEQVLVLQGAGADKFKIRAGQRYHYQRGVVEGRMVTWRERLDMGSLCRAYNLYDEGRS